MTSICVDCPKTDASASVFASIVNNTNKVEYEDKTDYEEKKKNEDMDDFYKRLLNCLKESKRKELQEIIEEQLDGFEEDEYFIESDKNYGNKVFEQRLQKWLNNNNFSKKRTEIYKLRNLYHQKKERRIQNG